MTPAERATATPAELVRLNLDLERGPMVLDDLRRLPAEPLVVADGSTVLPELVAQGHVERDRAVWLLPTFERHCAFCAASPTSASVPTAAASRTVPFPTVSPPTFREPSCS
jgi:hypothetical protein